MDFVGLKDFVQDWDAMRAALGYDKVSLAVVSFTFPGLEYATHFPNRVDKFVLDTSIPHGMPYQGMVSFKVGTANRLVQHTDAFCLTDPTCPFHRLGNSSVVKMSIDRFDRPGKRFSHRASRCCLPLRTVAQAGL
ncbi:hypothetical protein B0H14DRAFT_2642033 [Mycena olivaceomarginata]|nr:hypothetical protein B0H14DRAFT_2642033 [Mycena olivaceomarginata]